MDDPIPFDVADPSIGKTYALRVELRTLEREHRDLDDAVRALQATPRPDPLTLQRLKRKKLSIKDRIAAIEDQIFPDIIA